MWTQNIKNTFWWAEKEWFGIFLERYLEMWERQHACVSKFIVKGS